MSSVKATMIQSMAVIPVKNVVWREGVSVRFPGQERIAP
jgi:hypothetical protein